MLEITAFKSVDYDQFTSVKQVDIKLEKRNMRACLKITGNGETCSGPHAWLVIYTCFVFLFSLYSPQEKRKMLINSLFRKHTIGYKMTRMKIDRNEKLHQESCLKKKSQDLSAI